VQSVVPYRTEGESSGLGAVAGGVVGGLLGNQIGGGNGRKLATIAGAGGGAYVGNRIEKTSKARTRYKITVRMDGGSTRSFHLADGGWMPGDRVVVSDGRLLPAGHSQG
jgi:outer membrane lipoprotein SlyB